MNHPQSKCIAEPVSPPVYQDVNERYKLGDTYEARYGGMQEEWKKRDEEYERDRGRENAESRSGRYVERQAAYDLFAETVAADEFENDLPPTYNDEYSPRRSTSATAQRSEVFEGDLENC